MTALMWSCAACEAAGTSPRLRGVDVTHGLCDLHLELTRLEGSGLGIWRRSRQGDEGRRLAAFGSEAPSLPALAGAAA